MKYINIFAMMFLSACGGSEDTPLTPIEIITEVNEVFPAYVVSGQSNAVNCDWNYFTDITGYKVILAAKSGYLASRLIEEYESLDTADLDVQGIIFVHGEADSMNLIPVDTYVSQVEEIRTMISDDVGKDLTMFISTVGYYDKFPDTHFDTIREGVISNSTNNPKWIIAYNDAQLFRDWGLLSDGIHFNSDGCQLMMEQVAMSLE